MPVPLFTNNATGTLAGSYNAAATAITLTAGQGVRFPTPTGGDWFMATIVDNLNNIEIVKVTARATDTLTVVRGQEGTTARALGAGEKLDLRVTAGVLAAIRDKTISAADLADGSITGPKLADASVSAAKIAANAIDAATKIANGVITGAKLAAGAAVTNLGFTPVQQGGGTGQTNNKIYIGWSEPKIRAQVDALDYGYLLGERNDGSAASAGYRGVPQNQQENNYQIGSADGGKMLLHAGGGNHTYTLPSDTTPFDPGATIEILNIAGTITIQPAGGVTLYWLPSGGTGARTLAGMGIATLQKYGANTWIVTGAGLT